MRPWTRWFYLMVVISIVTTGCKSTNTTLAGTVTVSPATPTVFVSGMIQFGATAPNATTAITWAVNGTGGANGTIDASTGLYTAPSIVPAGATITITATQGSVSGTTTVTVDSGVRLSVTPSTATVGTLENFTFNATVTGVPIGAVTSTCGTSSTPPCTAVTWTVTSGTGTGSIGSSTGIYTAPAAAHADTITATSIYDTTKTATATVNVVAAVDPTITSISPSAGATGALAFQGAVGAIFQDVYLTGTSFISTTTVFINNGGGP